VSSPSGRRSPAISLAAVQAGETPPADLSLQAPDGADERTDDAGAADGEWGVAGEPAAPDRGAVPGTDPGATGREGQGVAGGGAAGAGPGVLGALHVVKAGPADRSAYWQLRGALAPEIERLAEGLREASDDYYAHVPRRFQRSGRLDRNRLPAAVAGREGVFVRFVPRPLPEHALCLLLDCSASMTTQAEQLRAAAIVVESAASMVGARVSAFTFGASWERLEPAADGAPLVALGRELHPHGGTPFGPAVAAAAAWLAHLPCAHKRLWVFSDGQWSARDRAGTAWRPELLKDVVVWVFAGGHLQPPTPAMRIAPVPALDDLIRLAPRYF
jgi:hypothetical protein